MNSDDVKSATPGARNRDKFPTAVLSIRPERVAIAAQPSGLDNSLSGTVEFVSYLGASIDIHVRLSPSDRLVAQIANRDDGFTPEVGQSVHVGWQASAGQVFAR